MLLHSHTARRRSALATAATCTSLLIFSFLMGAPAQASVKATEASAVLSNGEWPGVGKICESGSGGTSSVRGVGQNSIHIAAFNDESNTDDPGLEKEFVQFADAFAAWCNASGGINGRHIVIDNRDAALFNAAQVTNDACQSDFMAVGGGMVLDQSAVPIREACGLGQITGYTPSDADDTASDQVNPSNVSLTKVSAGWFSSLAKKYPSAVKKASMGSINETAGIEAERKYEDAAQASGWKVPIFQTVPLSVNDWTPYIQQLQTQGITADWPSDGVNLAPYLQAMVTAGYKPAFLVLGVQFYTAATAQSLKGLGNLPPVYVETSWWPLEMASQNPSTEQLLKVMHKYGKGATVDFNDEEAAESWLLWAKDASACGNQLTVECVLDNAAATKNWSAGGIEAPQTTLSLSTQDQNPSPCFLLLRVEPNKFVYDRFVTQPTKSIWNCNPKNVYQLTPQQQAALKS